MQDRCVVVPVKPRRHNSTARRFSVRVVCFFSVPSPFPGRPLAGRLDLRDGHRALIDLRVLGSSELRSDDGDELRSVLRQPKTFALLVYLAAVDPGGFHRRDELLALFWPEVDDFRARRSLRKTLYTLRRTLGEDAIASRGRDEVGVDVEVVRCDVRSFREALKRGDREEALELYRGELLPGFHLTGLHDFGEWLEGTRRELRALALEAAWGLARQQEDEGEVQASRAWARRAVAWASPYDEVAFRRYLELLDRLGDRGEALRAYEGFAKRMEAELDVRPSPETRELVETVREREQTWRSGRAVVQEVPERPPRGAGTAEATGRTFPWPRAAAGREGAGPDRAPRERVRPPRARRATLRRAGMMMGGVVALAALVYGGRQALRVADPGPGGSPASFAGDRVAVLPFTVRGTPEFVHMGEALSELLSTTLDGAGGLRSVDPARVIGLTQTRSGAESLSPGGAAVAARLGATLYVTGSVTAVDGFLRIRASLFELDDDEPVAQADAEGRETDLFRVVDELTIELLAGRWTGRGDELAGGAALTTSSLPAMKAFLEGQRLFRSPGFTSARPGPVRDSALRAYQRAVAQDSTFALGWLGVSRAAAWMERLDIARDAVERASRLSEDLPLRHRLLLDGYRGYFEGRPAEAERAFRKLVEAYPESAEAWYGYGDIIFHFGPILGRSRREAEPLLSRALELDSDHRLARSHLQLFLSPQDSRASVDSLRGVIFPDGPPVMVQAHTAFWWGREEERRRALSALRSAPALEVFGAASVIALDPAHLDDVLAVVSLLDHPSRSPAWRAAGHILRAGFLLAQGRRVEADRQLDAAAQSEPTAAMAHRALFASLPFLSFTAPELAALRDSLLALPRNPGAWCPNSPACLLPDGGGEMLLPPYLAGQLSARLGDEERALRFADELEARAAPSALVPLARTLAASVRARVALVGGETAAGLHLLQGEGMEWSKSQPEVSLVCGLALERFLTAEALRKLGRGEEALPFLTTLGELGPLEWIYVAPSRRRAAEILEEGGRWEAARPHRELASKLWPDAERELATRRNEPPAPEG